MPGCETQNSIAHILLECLIVSQAREREMNFRGNGRRFRINHRGFGGRVCLRPQFIRLGKQAGCHAFDERHLIVVRVTGAIPFDDRELGIVESPQFTGAKGAGDLIDRPCAGRQQPLHPELGRRLQEELGCPFAVVRVLRDGKRFQPGINHDVVREQGGFHFPVLGFVKAKPRVRKQGSSRPKRRKRCRWSEPIGTGR